MEMWHAPVLALIGIIAGWMNVMAGGGSLLTIPAMVFMGMPGPVANGTNRVAILAQNVTAVVTFFRQGYSEFALSVSLAVAASIGAVGGALVGVRLSGPWFERTVAIVMVGVMILMWRSNAQPASENTGSPVSRRRTLWGHVLMIGAGFWGGFIQIGVGFILMPILHRVLGLDLVRVNMHKVFIVLVYTIVALAVYAWQTDILWFMGASLALGNAAGGWLGARTTVSRGEPLIRIVLNVVLVAFIVKLIAF